MSRYHLITYSKAEELSNRLTQCVAELLSIVGLEGLLNVLPSRGVLWLFTGGLCYTVGIISYAINWIPYHHAIWHLFVIAGSLSR